MSDLDARIEATKTRLKQLQAQKAMLEARKRAAEAKRKRAEDTHRKILLGAAVLARVQRGEWPESKMLDMLNKELTRAEDRQLFGLPLKPTPDKPVTESGG
jgi:predicted O-linked N-acetylglucosamine transferase (SPINDLY family)